NSAFHKTPPVTEIVLWQPGTNNQGEVYAKLEVATRSVEYSQKRWRDFMRKFARCQDAARCMSYHIRNVPGLPSGREGRSFHILPALSPRMIAGRRAMRPACRSRRFRGWGCRGRGSAPSSAPRRRRSQGNFAKRQALSAIVNDDVSWLVLPHPHSALSRRPVTILPRELQQAVFVTHHPVFTEHSFFLQPEHVVQLSRRGTLPMIVGFSGRRSRVVAIVLGDVMLLQISIGIVIVADCGQPQLLDQPVLMGTVHALHPPLGLRRTGGDDADPQLGAHLSELGDRGFSPQPLLHVGQAHIHVLPVGV